MPLPADESQINEKRKCLVLDAIGIPPVSYGAFPIGDAKEMNFCLSRTWKSIPATELTIEERWCMKRRSLLTSVLHPMSVLCI